MALNSDIFSYIQSLSPGMPPDADAMSMLYPAASGLERSEILVAVSPADYSAAVIARAVEDCDAHLVNLNVTSGKTATDDMVVALRVDAGSPDGVARSLERYGLRVLAAAGSRPAIGDDERRRRASHLLHLLEL